MTLLREILLAGWETLFQAAPFILFGLLVAGLMQVFVPTRLLVRWMGGDGLLAAVRATLVGVPLPVCSCGVVPISLALRKKGAGEPANLAFLISTPETDVDAVLLTWGLLGPVMAAARLITGLVNAMVAAVLAIAFPPAATSWTASHCADPLPTGCCGPGHTHAAGDGHDHGEAAVLAEAEDAVPPREVLAAFRRLLRNTLFDRDRSATNAAAGLPTPGAAGDAAAAEPAAAVALTSAEPTSAPPTLRGIFGRVFRHAFVELVDEIVFWLAIGVGVAAVIQALVPAGTLAAVGSGIWAMLAVLAISVPMYVCASASTPIAAALIAKGVSPGAALVFLLAGPATNAATIALIGRGFGRRFLNIYLGSIIVTSIIGGLGLDALLLWTGWRVIPNLTPASGGVLAFVQLVSVALLVLLMIWRLAAGAARKGFAEVVDNLGATRRMFAELWPTTTRSPTNDPNREENGDTFGEVAGRRRWPKLLAGLATLLWLASGLVTVPADSRGFGYLFGRIAQPDLAPGLHWVAPAPLGKVEIRRASYPRKTDVGFRSDLDQLARRRELASFADPRAWHSPLAAMNTDPEVSVYLAGDENLVELSFTVHYSLVDPYAFFFRVDRPGEMVSLYAQAAARELVATSSLEELLTTNRQELERFVAADLTKRLDAIGLGVVIQAVRVVDIHPPQDAVAAFRDVSSAREDRETRIHGARESQAREGPLARGQAALTLAEASARADGARVEATGNASSLIARGEAFAKGRGVLRRLLWIEANERALAGREKYVLPPGSGGGINLWAPLTSNSLPAPWASPLAGQPTPVSPNNQTPGPTVPAFDVD